MSDVKPFVPFLVEEPKSYLDFLTPGVKYPVGSRFGIARVVSNDEEWVKLCYEYSKENCGNCEVQCPFNTNSNRKES
jgi:hypothetical protein